MANERTYPVSRAGPRRGHRFYERWDLRGLSATAAGSYAVVARRRCRSTCSGWRIRSGQSYGSVIVVVPEPGCALPRVRDRAPHRYGKLPTARDTAHPAPAEKVRHGVRLQRRRRRWKLAAGFKVRRYGGKAAAEKTTGLAKIVEAAARLGDAHGDDAAALKTLESGLARFPDAPAIDRARGDLPGRAGLQVERPCPGPVVTLGDTGARTDRRRAGRAGRRSRPGVRTRPRRRVIGCPHDRPTNVQGGDSRQAA